VLRILNGEDVSKIALSKPARLLFLNAALQRFGISESMLRGEEVRFGN